MGSPKPLLDWGGEPLVAFQVRQLQEAGADLVVVVLGHAASEVRPAIRSEGVRVVINTVYEQGRATSVRAGAVAIPDAEAIFVLNVDQPRPWEVGKTLLAAHRNGDAIITVPEYDGHRQHPILFSGSLLRELQEVTEETEGIREVMERHRERTQRVPIDDSRLALDFNTSDAYRQAHLLWFGRPPATAP
jgi:molybdenum cofactor cytidylyltransferase